MKTTNMKRVSKFLLYFLTAYVVFYYLGVQNFQDWIIYLTKEMSKFILGFFWQVQDKGTFLYVGNLAVTFSLLCTGAMEAAVLISSILATWEIEWIKRIKGAIAGIVFVVFLNQLRILVSIEGYYLMGLNQLDFLHNFLFRITLFLSIIGFYMLWVWWVQNSLEKKEKK